MRLVGFGRVCSSPSTNLTPITIFWDQFEGVASAKSIPIFDSSARFCLDRGILFSGKPFVRAARIHHEDQPPLHGNDPYPAKKDSNKNASGVLREMKRVVTVVRAHAQRYHTLLDENWQATDWTRPQAEQVLKRLESMIRSSAAGC
jgi:hypothetical protein